MQLVFLGDHPLHAAQFQCLADDVVPRGLLLLLQQFSQVRRFSFRPPDRLLVFLPEEIARDREHYHPNRQPNFRRQR